MSGLQFLQTLINASEKAANIARACRQEKELFKLLVEEKSNEEKNQRFLQDFKTLADVLIQETVKHDLGKKFPCIADHIKGEESNTFTNTLGESITVKVMDQVCSTSALLCKVLDGDAQAANLLSKEVHRTVEADADLNNLAVSCDLPMEDLGVWIDPIDSTAEYIQGDECKPSKDGIYTCGLRCVTVLIGVYLRSTGRPVMGVVNQPFFEEDSEKNIWKGKYYWGLSYKNVQLSSITGNLSPSKVILLSGSEGEQLKNRLKNKYHVVEAAGAGYKQLCVAVGLADIYILSRGSTFRWDTCAPHALLKAQGGGVINYKRFSSITEFTKDAEDLYGIDYQQKSPSGWCNSEGIIAFSNTASLLELFSNLKE